MWYEFLLGGLKKFAGEIIGVILLAIFWRMFPRLWAWVSQYKTQKKDDADVMQALEKVQSQLDAERREKERIQAESQRESERRAEVQRQLEAQRKEQERIQAEIRHKEKLSQEEARRLEEALRESAGIRSQAPT